MLWLQFLIALGTMIGGVFVLHKIDNKPYPECDIHFEDSPCEGDMDETPLAEDYNEDRQLFVRRENHETTVVCGNSKHPDFKCRSIVGGETRP